MVGGIGDLFGGIGSIVGSVINAGNQARANDIAEQNGIMQYMLGNRNIATQERLGTRNLNLQEEFGNRNFNLQKNTADSNYFLADTQGQRVLALIQAMSDAAMRQREQGLGTQQQGLDLQREALKYARENTALQRDNTRENIDLAKSSRFDAQGNEVYYDAATKSFKIRLAPNEQRLMDANQLENLRRSTIDQDRARRGNEQNEQLRTTANTLLQDAVREQRFGALPVNEGELANQLIVADRGEREDQMKNIRQALVTSAMRTNNTSSIDEIGRQVRSSANANQSGSVDAMLKAKQFALGANNQEKQNRDQRVGLLSALAKFTGDQNNAMGNSTGFATTTQQADQGGDRLAGANSAAAQGIGSALLGEGANETAFGNATKQFGLAQSALGDAYDQRGATIGGAINNRTSSMINALTNGAAAQGGALTSSAAAQGNAYSNLMQALAGAYTSQASGVGEAMGQQAKILANSKLDLSGLGKIGSGLGGLFAALGSAGGGEGGTTVVNKRVF